MSRYKRLLLISILLISLLASSITQVFAEDYGDKDASNQEDFESYEDWRIYQLWSVFRKYGMTENETVAVIACAMVDSNLHPEQIYGFPVTDENYIADNSHKWDTSVTFRTQKTIDQLLGAGLVQAQIDGAIAGTNTSVVLANSKAFDLSEYFIDGKGYGLVGLYPLKGQVLIKFFSWCKDRNTRWYNFETQLIFLLTDASSNGYKGEAVTHFTKTNTESNLKTCVSEWAKVLDPNVTATEILNKQAKAEEVAEYVKRFYSVGNLYNYDLSYANRVLHRLENKATVEEIEEEATNEIIDKSILHQNVAVVLYFPKNVGFLLAKTREKEMDAHNEEVFKGYVNSLNGLEDNSKTYSLFELYGEDLHWYRYFGEATYIPSLLDHVWSALDQDKTDQLVSFDTINWYAKNYLSCQVYPDRPEVLSQEDIANGNRDPRVLALSNGWFNGFQYTFGSIKMTIAKYFVALVSFLMGPEIKDFILKVINFLESSIIWQGFKGPLKILFYITVVCWILSFAAKAWAFMKGKSGLLDYLKRFLIGAFCMFLFWTGLEHPASLNKVVDSTVTAIDSVFSYALADNIKDDEVIAVQDKSLAIHAVLWKTAIFNAWCRGQFDERNYNELYTQYATLEEGQDRMPQSHQEIDPTDMMENAVYDSAKYTGDVFVPVGGGKQIRNWAAYLMSCDTDYHIDSTLDSDKASQINTLEGIFFPHETMMTTANNIDLNADTFRVIDAQMDISPQIYSSGSITSNYVNSHQLVTHFSKQGTVMLFNAALLIFFVPVIFKKITSFLLLLFTTIKMILYGLLELFKEGSNVHDLLVSIKKALVDYFASSLRLCLLVMMYYLLVDKSILLDFLYIVVALVILSFSWKDFKRFVADTKRKASNVLRQV